MVISGEAALRKAWVTISETGLTKKPQPHTSDSCAKDVSPKKVRGYDAEKFSGSDNLGVLPKLWEMALVARH
jgi:hypothetical protein